MEARSLAVGQCPVVGFLPSELEPHAEGLVRVPEQAAIEGAVADSSRGGDIAASCAEVLRMRRQTLIQYLFARGGHNDRPQFAISHSDRS
jgi:hypothetical protein